MCPNVRPTFMELPPYKDHTGGEVVAIAPIECWLLSAYFNGLSYLKRLASWPRFSLDFPEFGATAFLLGSQK